jgi:hypothetical protein
MMLTFAQFQKLQEDKMLPIKKVPTLLPQIPNVADRHRAARAKWQGIFATRPMQQQNGWRRMQGQGRGSKPRSNRKSSGDAQKTNGKIPGTSGPDGSWGC